MGVVDQTKLDQLYKWKKQGQKISKRAKEILTLGLGLLLPSAIGGAIWRNYLKPGEKGILKRTAPLFDYVYPRSARFLRSWPMMSVAGLMLSSLILTVGELAAARSKREFKTLAIQRKSIDGLFFFGTPLLMMLFNKGARNAQETVQKAEGKTADPVVLKQTANRSAGLFVASFILNLLAVSGIVTFTNRLTKKQVADAASGLPSQSRPFHVPKPFTPFVNPV